MTDGPSKATDLDRTESNRETVRAFVDDLLVHRRPDKLDHYVDQQKYTEHSPQREDGYDHLVTALSESATETPAKNYNTIHRVLAEGNFVLSICEGTHGETHCSFYDLHSFSMRSSQQPLRSGVE